MILGVGKIDLYLGAIDASGDEEKSVEKISLSTFQRFFRRLRRRRWRRDADSFCQRLKSHQNFKVANFYVSLLLRCLRRLKFAGRKSGSGRSSNQTFGPVPIDSARRAESIKVGRIIRAILPTQIGTISYAPSRFCFGGGGGD